MKDNKELKSELISFFFGGIGLLIVFISIYNYFKGVDLAICLSSGVVGTILLVVGKALHQKLYRKSKE